MLQMTWRELCFLHWAVRPEQVAAHLPEGVELDLWQGKAYLGVVPFSMTGIRPRLLPGVPGLSNFPELNLRTYVTVDGVPGVWFFSLDASQPLGVRLARRFFHLPYFDARMQVGHKRGSGVINYASMRTHAGQPALRFAAAYAPEGPVFRAEAGSLEDWLTSRYALFSADARGRVYRGLIRHEPWALQRARAVVSENTLAQEIGLTLEGKPHLLYGERTDVRAWLVKRVK